MAIADERRLVAAHPRLLTAVAVGAVVAAVVLVWRTDAPTPLVGHLLMLGGLVPLVVIDLVEHRLPRELSYPTALVSSAALAGGELVGNGELSRIVGVGGGAALFVGLIFALAVASRGGMGDGDIRLAPLLGANLGYHSITLVPIALFGAALVGLLAALPPLISREANMKTSVPFGPSLAAGTVVTIALFA